MGANQSLGINNLADFLSLGSGTPNFSAVTLLAGLRGKNGLGSSTDVMETANDLSVVTVKIPKSTALYIVGVSNPAISGTNPDAIVSPNISLDPAVEDVGGNWEISTATSTTGTSYIYYIKNSSA